MTLCSVLFCSVFFFFFFFYSDHSSSCSDQHIHTISAQFFFLCYFCVVAPSLHFTITISFVGNVAVDHEMTRRRRVSGFYPARADLNAFAVLLGFADSHPRSARIQVSNIM
jgi:hypothetical protein